MESTVGAEESARAGNGESTVAEDSEEATEGGRRTLERSWQHMFVRAAAASDSSLLGEDMRSGVDGASISLRLSPCHASAAEVAGRS